MKKKLHILQPDKNLVDKISKAVKCTPFIALLLVNRRIITAKEAHAFLNISIDNLRPPFFIKDMEIAVNRIYKAIMSREKILVFGDYDVDGVTSTALLVEFLLHTGADVSYYIPDRLKEGYGLREKHIPEIARANNINLIITVDCGSSSHEAATAANDAGIDIIITDHHKVSEKLPEALAIISPKRPDCSSGLYDLAGVGVAFYLVICLRKHLRDMHFWDTHPEPNLKNLCDLIALGTVADMVPLLEENRILTKTGLDLINSGKRPGINALVKASNCKNSIDSEDIAFRLAPRINAMGRVDNAKDAVKLLLTNNPNTADNIARQMNSMNIKRQNIEKKIFNEILEYIQNNPNILLKKSIVLSHHSWHEGVLGIIASKLVERYNRPTILFAQKDDIAKGSGRSTSYFDLYEGLAACSNLLEAFGGHSMAAGVTIKIQNLSLFEREFENTVLQISHSEDLLTDICIDYELAFDEICADFIDEIESLKPFGTGNPEPVFLARNISVISSDIVGENHRRMVLSDKTGNINLVYNAIHFNIDKDMPEIDFFEQIAFRLRWNRWNGNKSIQLVIENI
ncbi:MAG: single-stranded-DNA-specific exonuclease RecJ [Proteobacteria bacterium]|nr:single-stranded-DNA-specific exonuclease RecJ [Pseudomonadota bacterium]